MGSTTAGGTTLLSDNLPTTTGYVTQTYTLTIPVGESAVIFGVGANGPPAASGSEAGTVPLDNISITSAGPTVPEPASVGLAGLAAVGLLARRRRRA